MASSGPWPEFRFNIRYSEKSDLNTLETCIPRPPSAADAQRYWIVFIHGGAWIDPAVTAASFRPTQAKLLASNVAEHVAGYASLNYRLSPYPSHATDPSKPGDPARNAQHPDHIEDVLAALLQLQCTHGFDERYVLVGHSAGATLALQVAMKKHWRRHHTDMPALEGNVKPPAAIVGLAGLYDLPALALRHTTQPQYRMFLLSAFEEKDWSLVSPTRGDYETGWPEGRVVVLADSRVDSLVESEQHELQRRVLEMPGWKNTGSRTVTTFDLHGDHDEIWKTGDAARAIEVALRLLLNGNV